MGTFSRVVYLVFDNASKVFSPSDHIVARKEIYATYLRWSKTCIKEGINENWSKTGESMSSHGVNIMSN